MKKIKLLIILFVCLFAVNVKADMGPPSIVSHDVMVTNKDGAQCYDDGKKTSVVIPYKTKLGVSMDISGNYIWVTDNADESDNCKYCCFVKYSDVSAVNQNFSLNNQSVEKITTTKAIILPSGGVNLRKGPAVTYSRITTVPQYTILTVTHRAGELWYYTKYNGNSGWITSMKGYLGFEDKRVLYNYESVKIYDSKGKAIGTIPANTPIEKYLILDIHVDYNARYYVIYNNIKGYIKDEMYIKIDSPGKIKLTMDYVLDEDENGNVIKKIAKGTELEYTMLDSSGDEFYVPAQKKFLYPDPDTFEYVKKAVVSTKKTGYLGEGLFGEKKEEVTEPKQEEKVEDVEPPVIPKEEKESMSTKDMIIIGLLGGIFLALTALVIIRLVNSKRVNTKPIDKSKDKSNIVKVTDSEIEKAREVIKRETNNSEPTLRKPEVKLGDELDKMKSVDEENKD